MAEWLQTEAKKLSFNLEARDIGVQQDVPGSIQLPPILVGKYGGSSGGKDLDKNKKTILIYGHYDVQPANKEDGWESDDPFQVLEKEDGKMIARGITDDKGPVMGWFNAIEAYQAYVYSFSLFHIYLFFSLANRKSLSAGIELPVNLIFCLEGMEEYGSEGLEDFIKQEKNDFFKETDAICISDNYWLGTTKPVLTYGLRGCSYYAVTVEGPETDLHSGVFGGTVCEPMTDLIQILNTLVAPASQQHKILIPGVNEMVAPVSEDESAIYDQIQFEMQDLDDAVGAKISLHPTTKDTLMARWRMPALSIHGIEGAFSASGAKTVIPAKVTAKFSIRTVPNIDIHSPSPSSSSSSSLSKLDQAVYTHIESAFSNLGSKNSISIKLLHAGNWWVSDPNNWNFQAAKLATKAVWNVEPDLTREGGSIPVTLTFEQELGKPVLLLPMGRGDDGAHSTQEKLDRSNYVQGTKTLASYLYYASKV